MAKKIPAPAVNLEELSPQMAEMIRNAQARKSLPAINPAAAKAIKDAAKAKAKPVIKPPVLPAKSADSMKPAKKPAAPKAVKLAAVKEPLPFCYLDYNKHTFLVVQRKDGIAALLTMRSDVIDIEYHREDEIFFQSLTPCARQDSMKDAVRTHVKSTLPKSDLAGKVLNAIIFSTDPDQVDFVGDIVAQQAAAALTSGTGKKTSTKARKARKTAKTASVKASRVGFITLAEIASELKFDPKHIRVQLRTHLTKPDGGWAWPVAEKDAVVKSIKSWMK